MARLLRDAHGVPHLRADSLLELVRAQGEVTAHDRTWQLEWLRRRATGTTAQLLGASGVGWDVLARRTRLVDLARRAHDRLAPETRAVMASYAAGVTAGLREDAPELVGLGARPQPWEPWTPVAVFAAHHLLFGSLGAALWRRRVREVLGDEADLLDREGPAGSGSNAWAVGGDRTASGLPLVGGDPHRGIDQPNAYLQVRLACDDPDDPFDVAGFTLAGLPGVQHFAHAGDVAWAITNAMADNQDVLDVDLREGGDPVLESWVERVEVRDAEGVDVEVLLTEHGPVLEGGRGGAALVLRHVAARLGDLGLDAVPALLRARTVADVDAALDHWVEPVNNVVVADVHGRVLYRVAGRVPVRDPDGGWTGWLDPLPRTEVPPGGQVVTANERRGPESAAIGTSYAAPWRAQRLHALLEGRDDLTAADFAGFHDDDLLLAATPLLDLLTRAVPDHALLGWDQRMSAGSVLAGLFARWRSALTHRIATLPALAPLHEPRHDAVLAPWLDLTSHVGLALPTIAATPTAFGADLVALAREAWLQVVDEPAATWGSTHVLAPVHALGADAAAVPAVPVSGDAECVRCTGSVPGVLDACSRGSVARYVWDLADRAAGGWVVPAGVSGVPGDPHHLDQLPLWAAGRLAPLVTDWERLEGLGD